MPDSITTMIAELMTTVTSHMRTTSISLDHSRAVLTSLPITFFRKLECLLQSCINTTLTLMKCGLTLDTSLLLTSAAGCNIAIDVLDRDERKTGGVCTVDASTSRGVVFRDLTLDLLGQVRREMLLEVCEIEGRAASDRPTAFSAGSLESESQAFETPGAAAFELDEVFAVHLAEIAEARHCEIGLS